jgi:hypothetical protein
MKLYCKVCKKETERGDPIQKRSVDEPATFKPCPCTEVKAELTSKLLSQSESRTRRVLNASKKQKKTQESYQQQSICDTTPGASIFTHVGTDSYYHSASTSKLLFALTNNTTETVESEIKPEIKFRLKFEYSRVKPSYPRHLEYELNASVVTVFSSTVLLHDQLYNFRFTSTSGEMKEGTVTAESVLEEVRVAPGVTLQLLVRLEVEPAYFQSLRSHRRSLCSTLQRKLKVYQLGEWSLTFESKKPGSGMSVYADYLGEDEPTVQSITQLVLQHTVEFSYMDSLWGFFPASYRDSVIRAHTPVYDHPKHSPPADCTYMVKPDGERNYVFLCGLLQVFCRPKYPLTVTGIIPSAKPHLMQDLPDVHCCEVLCTGEYLYLHSVFLSGAVLHSSPAIIGLRATLKLGLETESMIIRNSFSSYEEAVRETKRVSYPCDGVVCVNEATGFTFRFKHPTIDLFLKKGKFRSSSGRAQKELKLKAGPHLLNNRVYECRFQPQPESNQLAMLDCIYRPDKSVANTPAVIDSIVSIALDRDVTEECIRRIHMSFSYKLKSRY